MNQGSSTEMQLIEFSFFFTIVMIIITAYVVNCNIIIFRGLHPRYIKERRYAQREFKKVNSGLQKSSCDVSLGAAGPYLPYLTLFIRDISALRVEFHEM